MKVVFTPSRAGLLAALLLALTLAACGQKGALYHPDEEEQQKAQNKEAAP